MSKSFGPRCNDNCLKEIQRLLTISKANLNREMKYGLPNIHKFDGQCCSDDCRTFPSRLLVGERDPPSQSSRRSEGEGITNTLQSASASGIGNESKKPEAKDPERPYTCN
ncbi:unnamed protein product [Lepeophtheirus salmonis]|uniref:(salmon louse) hypothetical protein n=1 Tax=Lepeophtheirus salmonis TaxID=72036 RepID=A0A7R8HAQ5_LEPSM|nr:unnamed protein product [Lepeophtheirus salmonis]CAF2974590.1 unnamed protein product [Lepeophtheirus salmonis]